MKGFELKHKGDSPVVITASELATRPSRAFPRTFSPEDEGQQDVVRNCGFSRLGRNFYATIRVLIQEGLFIFACKFQRSGCMVIKKACRKISAQRIIPPVVIPGGYKVGGAIPEDQNRHPGRIGGGREIFHYREPGSVSIRVQKRWRTDGARRQSILKSKASVIPSSVANGWCLNCQCSGCRASPP